MKSTTHISFAVFSEGNRPNKENIYKIFPSFGRGNDFRLWLGIRCTTYVKWTWELQMMEIVEPILGLGGGGITFEWIAYKIY